METNDKINPEKFFNNNNNFNKVLGASSCSQNKSNAIEVKQNSLNINETNNIDRNIIESLDSLFKNVDKNKSGKVSLTKTKKLFQQINQNFNTTYTSADAKRLFEKCVKNEEGAISLEDFKREFQTIKPLTYNSQN